MNDVVDSLIPKSGPFHLLEVGCGSGVYLFRALRRNLDLTAVGVEIKSHLADAVRSQVSAQALDDRVTILDGDVRDLHFPEPPFDLITLHNNIYYFPESERDALLQRLTSWIQPGGRLAVTTSCPGGNHFSSYMRLWAAMTEGAGPLPDPTSFCAQLINAGLVKVQSRKLVALDSYRVFLGTKPATTIPA